ncbi:MAG: S4 domain-containing protein, partial [Haliscomenobacter sp.]
MNLDLEAPNHEHSGDDLYDFQHIKVDPGQEPMRIDKFLFDRMAQVSRNRIQQAIRAGAILVNDQEIK